MYHESSREEFENRDHGQKEEREEGQPQVEHEVESEEKVHFIPIAPSTNAVSSDTTTETTYMLNKRHFIFMGCLSIFCLVLVIFGYHSYTFRGRNYMSTSTGTNDTAIPSLPNSFPTITYTNLSTYTNSIIYSFEYKYRTVHLHVPAPHVYYNNVSLEIPFIIQATTYPIIDNYTIPTIDGDIFSIYARGPDGDFTQALLTKLGPGKLMAIFPPFSFVEGNYTLNIVAEQFVDDGVDNSTSNLVKTSNNDNYSGIQTLSSIQFQKEALLQKDGCIKSILNWTRWDTLYRSDAARCHIPVCDNGGGNNISYGLSFYNEAKNGEASFQSITIERPTIQFQIHESQHQSQHHHSHNKDNDEYNGQNVTTTTHLSSLGACHLSSSKHTYLNSNPYPGYPGGFFNTTSCNGLSSFCCSNTINGWDFMYRKNDCCYQMVDAMELQDLRNQSHRIFFAGDSTTNYLMQHGSILWPGVFPDVNTTVAQHTLSEISFIDFLWIARPYGNSLRNIMDPDKGTGKQFWEKVSESTIVVIHSCGHEVSTKHEPGGIVRKDALKLYVERLETISQMLTNKAKGKKVYWLSCGSQSYKNFLPDGDFWACEKDANCKNNLSSFDGDSCSRNLPDVGNWGWVIDFVTREVVERNGMPFIDVHTFSDAAKGDLSLFPHYNGPNGDTFFTGDIHLSKGRGGDGFQGWLYSLKFQLIMRQILNDSMK